MTTSASPRLGYYLLFGGILGFGTLGDGDAGLLVLDAALAAAGLLVVLRGWRTVSDAGLRLRLIRVDVAALFVVVALSVLVPAFMGLVKAVLVAVPAAACIFWRERILARAEVAQG